MSIIKRTNSDKIYVNKAVVWLCFSHLVVDIYGGFLNPLMPFLAEKLKFSIGLATIVISISHICSSILQPIFGFFADNILKRFFIFWGLIFSAIFIPLTVSASNIYLLVLFMILGSLGGSFFHPQAMGFINFFSKRQCSFNMGFFISLGSLGFAFGPLLATLITQYIGLSFVSYTSILGLIMACLMFHFVPKLSNSKNKPEKKEFIKSFNEILTNKQMMYLMIIAMMKSLVTNSSCILLPFLWKDLGYSPFYIGKALFLFVFAGAISSFLSPRLEKTFGAKPVIYFSMCSTFPIMLLMSKISHLNFALFVFAILGFSTMLAQPIVMVLAQRILPEYKSVVAGFINGFCWGIVALLLIILGSIAQKIGIMQTLIILSLLPVFFSYFVKYLNVNVKF